MSGIMQLVLYTFVHSLGNLILTWQSTFAYCATKLSLYIWAPRSVKTAISKQKKH